MNLRVWSVVAVLVLAACSPPPNKGDGGTADAGSLDAGPPDGGSHDAGPADAGVLDAGPTDAGLGDAGPGDAGETDAGLPDAGPMDDAGPQDAGAADGGPMDDAGSDAGPTDSGMVIHGDGGPADAGSNDAGPGDAGPPDAGPSTDAGQSRDAGIPDSGPFDAGPFDGGPVDAGPQDAGPLPVIDVQLSPTQIDLAAGDTQTFVGTVTGISDTSVQYTVVEASSCGSVDSASGVYRAPASAAVTTCHVHVVSTAAATTTHSVYSVTSATAAVTVHPLGSCTVTPAVAWASPGNTQTFVATVWGSPGTTFSWSTAGAASLGMVDQQGNFTAGSATSGQARVTATSTTDATKTATAVVNLVPVISISLCPDVAGVVSGESLQFTPLLSGATDASVTWSVTSATSGVADSKCGSISAGGLYTAPSQLSLCVSAVITATSNEDPRRVASAPTVIARDQSNLTGSVVYSGTRTGRIFVSISGPPGSSTVGTASIGGPGSFTLRGVDFSVDGTYTLMAWLDTIGDDTINAAADPMGQATFDISFGMLTPPGPITLTDPVPQVPAAPQLSLLFPCGSRIIATNSPALDSNGFELADNYVFYLDTSSSPGPASHIQRVVLAAGSKGVALGPLAAGTYYLSKTAVSNGMESATSAASDPIVVVGPPSSGNPVTGALDFPGLTSIAQAFVLLFSSNSCVDTEIMSPVTPAAFSISNVPDDSFQLFVALSALGGGIIRSTDVLASHDALPQVTVSGGPVSGLNLPLVTDPSLISMATTHAVADGVESFSGSVTVRSNTQIATRVAVVRGSGFTGVQDLGFNGTAFTGAAQITGLSPGTPNFDVQVTYAGGVTCGLSVSGQFPALPTSLAPAGAGASTTPVFSWTPPNPLPAGTLATLTVQSASGGAGQVWRYPLPSTTTTSVVYNTDGQAQSPALTSGAAYFWTIVYIDQNANTASGGATFTPQ